MDKFIASLQSMIDSSRHIVVLSGAGISTASGIPDIRSATGAMNNKDLLKKYKYSYETIVSHSFFLTHTEEFFNYYRHEMVHRDAKPNIAHLYLHNLEERKRVTIITQNIDGLHALAGSSDVIELHGSIQRNYCVNCGKAYSLDRIMSSENIPICQACGGVIKPDVVLFDESLDEEALNQAVIEIQDADLLLIIGSSLLVYPAASLPYYFKGNNIAIVNQTSTPLDRYAKLVIHEDILNVFSNLK